MIKGTNVKWLWLLSALLLAGCGAPSPTKEGERSLSLTDVLPGTDAKIPGWMPVGDAQTFSAENLYDLVDGQADAFFAYGFEQVAVRSYEDADGAILRLEVWQLEAPADAYGLFSTYRAGTPVEMGNEGDADPGRRLDFWQNRYFVRAFALQPLPEADVWTFAEAVASALPGGGKRPILVDRLPSDGLVERSAVFFHQEISIQSYIWLGGENLLGLSPDTNGVLARYELADGTAMLLLVEYPDAEVASAGLGALRSGQIDSLVIAEGRENMLSAVFGTVGEASAHQLLTVSLRED